MAPSWQFVGEVTGPAPPGTRGIFGEDVDALMATIARNQEKAPESKASGEDEGRGGGSDAEDRASESEEGRGHGDSRSQGEDEAL